MVYTVTEVCGWRVESWEAAHESSSASQDAKLVWGFEDRLRLAVIDGATPTAATPRHMGIDGAVWASALVRAALLNPQAHLYEAVLAASAELYDPSLPSHRDQPHAALVCCELTADGSAQFLRGGDCEAWLRERNEWQPVFASDRLKPDALRALGEVRARARREGIPRSVRHIAEEAIVGDVTVWNSSPIGRFPVPVLNTDRRENVQELVLCSDGARLNSEVLGYPESWLAHLRDWERRHHPSDVGKDHDDVTVLRVTRASQAC